MRATILEYKRSNISDVANVRFEIVEKLYGNEKEILFDAIWINRERGIPKAWPYSKNVIVALRRISNFHGGKNWQVIQSSCSRSGILPDDIEARNIILGLVSE